MPLLSGLLLVSTLGLIDVHRHAGWPDSDHEQVRQRQLELMEHDGVEKAVVAVTTREDVYRWQHEKIIVGVSLACPRNLAEPRYRCFPETEGWADATWLETEILARRIGALHELYPSYYGISPANPRFEPYWELSEKYSIPVGVHTQRGPPPGGRNGMRSDPNCCPDYDPAMGNPELLRPVLAAHPKVRIWLQHVGSGNAEYPPFWPETLSILADYPNVYVDLSITNGAMPVEQYERTLRLLIEAGFADRIMLGSDNLPIPVILERLNSFEWLTDSQKQAILRDNAVRFFRLTD